MQKITLTFIVFVLALTVHAQKKETRQVGSFDYVSLGIDGDLVITQGNSNSVVLEGNSDDLEKIETHVTSGKLKITTENSSWFGHDFDNIKIYVTLIDFTGASVSGSGSISNSNNLKGDVVDLGVSGSGSLNVFVNCNAVEAHISGSGKINLEGTSSSILLHISGSGNMNALNMETEKLEAHISGSGSAKLKVTKEIDAHISGSGRIRYTGNPAKIREKVSGSGSVKSM